MILFLLIYMEHLFGFQVIRNDDQERLRSKTADFPQEYRKFLYNLQK
jgi:hypothetical protein